MQARRDDGYEVSEHVASTHDCPDCGFRSRLVTKWDRESARYYPACGRCGRTEGLLRRKTLTQQWKENPESVPLHTANVLERKYGGTPLTTTALAQMDEKSLVQRMEGARWMDKIASPQDRRELAHLAIEYGLDPLMGELIIYEGKPYITIGGMIRKAHDSQEFAGMEDRPMTQEEQQAYGMKKPVCWIAKAHRRDWKVPAVGTGQADPERPFRNNPTERENPQWMARSRAIRQALRLAFPHSVPFQMDSAEDRGLRVDAETGEINTPVEERRIEVLRAQADPEPEPDVDESDPPEPTVSEQPAQAEPAKPQATIRQNGTPPGKADVDWIKVGDKYHTQATCQKVYEQVFAEARERNIRGQVLSSTAPAKTFFDAGKLLRSMVEEHDAQGELTLDEAQE